MHLLAPAGEVVLTLDVVLSLVHPRLAIFIFPVSAPLDLTYVGAQ
jgi:hypothetical protein